MHRMWCSALIVWSSQHSAEERLWGRGEASCRETVRKRRGWTKEWRGDSVSENVTLSSELRVVPHGCSEQIVRIIIPSVCVCSSCRTEREQNHTFTGSGVHPHTRSYHTCPAFHMWTYHMVLFLCVCVSGAHLVLAEGEFLPSPRALRSSCSKLDQISSSNWYSQDPRRSLIGVPAPWLVTWL